MDSRAAARFERKVNRERRAPSTFARKADADRWLASIEAEIERGRWVDPIAQATTVGDWGRRWLKSAEAHLKIKTFAGYKLLFDTKIEPTFGDQQLRAIKPMMISEWVAAMHGDGLAPSRVRQAYRLLPQPSRPATLVGLGQNPPGLVGLSRRRCTCRRRSTSCTCSSCWARSSCSVPSVYTPGGYQRTSR